MCWNVGQKRDFSIASNGVCYISEKSHCSKQIMIVVQHTQQKKNKKKNKQKKIVYYQKTEIFKNFLYFLKIEIIVHLIEKANKLLYSLKTKVLRNCVKNLVFYNLPKQKF